MNVALKRAYDSPNSRDGHRVLVDRLWPRGISKEQARIDAWPKEVAPSDELRKAFHDGRLTWGEFRRRYLGELKAHRDVVRDLAARAGRERVTLVFSAKDERRNNAVVLKQYLEMLRR